MSISVVNVTKLYGEQKALDNVNFETKKGEITGLIGPNGAGKSTMMKIITCFIPQTSGDVKVCGFDVVENPLEVRKCIGYLPENNPLYLEMYVREYLEFIAGIYKISKKDTKKRVEEMVDITGLGSESKKKIGALSKGFRQRVGLAQALIHNPRVLILDEPTSGLDPNQIIEIRNLIKSLGKEKTVILSTHIMQEVEAVCDRIIIINKGKIVANKNYKEVSKSQESVIIHVEFDKEIMLKSLNSIKGIKQIIQVNPFTWKIISMGDIDIRPELFQFAVKNNIKVLSMHKEEQSIEDLFQSLTK
ncbi:MAG: gliding motility-associated ABC transporter ATP-binding subunit GldA [Bacteroidota bacterium]|nr:gliding motility-associated ABC transporter ATP-binding subunit GldA [Bacteroidota bacterium]